MAYTSKLNRRPAGRVGLGGTLAGVTMKPGVQIGSGISRQGPAAASTSIGQRLGAMTPEQRQAFQAWTQAQGGQRPTLGSLSAQYSNGQPTLGSLSENFSHVGQPAPGRVSALNLPSSQLAAFQGQRDTINENYLGGLNDNTFQHGQENLGYTTQLRDLTQQFAQQRNAEPYNFLGRGILGSGIQHQDLQNMNINQAQGYGGLQQQHAGQLSSLDIARSQLEKQRAMALAALQVQQQQARAQYAQGTIR